MSHKVNTGYVVCGFLGSIIGLLLGQDFQSAALMALLGITITTSAIFFTHYWERNRG